MTTTLIRISYCQPCGLETQARALKKYLQTAVVSKDIQYKFEAFEAEEDHGRLEIHLNEVPIYDKKKEGLVKTAEDLERIANKIRQHLNQ